MTRSSIGNFLGRSQTTLILLVAAVGGAALGLWMAWDSRSIRPQLTQPIAAAVAVPQDLPATSSRTTRRVARAVKRGPAQPAATAPTVVTAVLPARVVVTRNTDVFVVPRATQDPLAHVEAGVELAVLGSRDDWYLIQYESARWGTRRAYIRSEAVKPTTP